MKIISKEKLQEFANRFWNKIKEFVKVQMNEVHTILERQNMQIKNLENKQIENDSNFIKKDVNNLDNYYKKEETYNKSIIDAKEEALNNKISAIPKFNIKVVEQLPTQDISSTTIYLLKSPQSSANNLYIENIYVNKKWEKLGEQTINLNEYLPKRGDKDARVEVASIQFGGESAFYYEDASDNFVFNHQQGDTILPGKLDGEQHIAIREEIEEKFAKKIELQSFYTKDEINKEVAEILNAILNN